MKNFLYQKNFFRIKIFNKKYYIFCIIRKKFYLLKKEEWVRQNLIRFLIKEKGYNKIFIEFPILFNNIRKRIDIIILKKNIPYILIECKAPNIKINFMKTIKQTFIYYNIIKCPYIMITNGINNKICFFNKKKIHLIDDLPMNNNNIFNNEFY